MKKTKGVGPTRLEHLGHEARAAVDGRFWIPDRPEKRIRGRLKYRTGNTCKLELQGAFGEVEGQALDFEQASAFDVLLGETMAGEKVTLVGCVQSDSFQSDNGVTSGFMVDSLIVGAHLETERGAAFMHAETTWDLLNEWFQHRQFKLAPGASGESIVQDQPEHQVLFSHRVESLNATIRSGMRISGGSEGRFGRLSLGHTMTLRIEPTGVASLQWFERQIRRLGNLLTLLLGVPAANSWIELRDAGDEGFLECYRFLKPLWAATTHETLLLRAPFSYPVVKECFGAVLEAWFSLCERCQDVIDAFFFSIASDRSPDHLRFLSTVHAIEGFLRVTDARVLMDPGQFEELRETLIGSIPSSTPERMRTALSARLRFANEPSLRRRLLDSLNDTPPAVLEYALSGASKPEFVAAVVDGRNYLAHYDPAARAQKLDGPGLAVWTSRMQTLFAIMLLHHVGFDWADAVRRLKSQMAWSPIRGAHLFREPEDDDA